MEEFKNLKEIIELCKEELENNDENTHATLDLVDLKELENLINKYKELNDEALKQSEWLVEKQKKIEEQEKIIELMAEKLAIYKFEEIICMETECEHVELQNEGKCIGDKECILEYFKKKARDENGNNNDN